MKPRVLIVDDSVVIRRLVTHALRDHPDIEVVGSASNGIIALQKIDQLHPHVVTLDIEMPDMDGLETLKRIRESYPKLFVIMFSTLTQRGATATIEALAAGANDYVTKAENGGSLDQSLVNLRAELVPKIRQFFDPQPRQTPTVLQSRRLARSASHAPTTVGRPEAVVLAISTGGPNALGRIIPMFPADFELPVLIVQHMPPLFTKLLAERLAGLAQIPVVEASNGMPVQKGHVYIAPGDFHMCTVRNATSVRIQLTKAEPVNSCRPAADVLFESAAQAYKGRVLAVVLTGMGQDGCRGSEAVKCAGGSVIAQDESSSVVWGMPGYVVRAGFADKVVSLDEVVPEIIRISGSTVSRIPPARTAATQRTAY